MKLIGAVLCVLNYRFVKSLCKEINCFLRLTVKVDQFQGEGNSRGFLRAVQELEKATTETAT